MTSKTVPRRNIRINTMLIRYGQLILYSGLLFPSFFALNHIRTTKIPSKEPPKVPVISNIRKKRSFMPESKRTTATIRGMIHAKVEEDLSFSL